MVKTSTFLKIIYFILNFYDNVDLRDVDIPLNYF